MKTVLLLRHAKSSWDTPGTPDHLRPLAPRGRKAAPRVAAYMARNGLIPDRVLCSPARRAVETWELVAPVLGSHPRVTVTEELYHASPGHLVETIRARPTRENMILLIGHNPSFEELALGLAGEGEPKALEKLHRKYPTAALAILDFDVPDWTGVGEGGGYLRDLVLPKHLV